VLDGAAERLFELGGHQGVEPVEIALVGRTAVEHIVAQRRRQQPGDELRIGQTVAEGAKDCVASLLRGLSI
jgi:hypothetical protein